jgi:DNA-3-methyladenine glycosylase II
MDNIVNQNDIKQLIKIDSIFALIHSQYGPPPNWSRPQGFITLSRIILEQQVSIESAKAHFNKLNNYLPEFTPEEIVKLSDDEMKNCQISKQKSKYLKSLALTVFEGKLDFGQLPKLTNQEIREKLKTVKGIGDWTVDIYLIFSLHSKDIFPVGDIAVINTIKELNNCSIKDEILKHSEKWKPYRSLATFYFWHYYLKKRNRNTII